jgi:hypothetical protein
MNPTPCLRRGFLQPRDGRLGSLVAWLGVLGILMFMLQLEDVLPQSIIKAGGSSDVVHVSSFVDCSDTSNAEGVRTQANHWGAFDPVISSTNCTTILASKKSSDPMDWLEMCMENHDIYQRYMTSKSRNFLKSVIPQIEGHDKRTTQFANSTNDEKVSMLIIGDSLDKFMAYHICNITHGVATKIDPPRFSNRRPFVCSSPTLEIAFFNVFGMKRTCSNDGVAHHQDNRSFNTTVDRIKSLLPDVLKLLDKKPQYVQIGSALWDLSQGCVSRNGVPQNYQDEYSLGMRNMYEHLISDHGGLAEDAKIYWRTSPPVRKSYSAKWARVSWIPFDVGGHGRTRRNQMILNQIMHDTVSDYHLGYGIVDWWQIVQGVPEKFLNQELPDGRHYVSTAESRIHHCEPNHSSQPPAHYSCHSTAIDPCS